MTVQYIDGEALQQLLPVHAAIDALQRAFASAPHSFEMPQRTHLPVLDGELLLMPAASASAGVGVKVVTLNPSNSDRGLPLIHGVYLLFHPDSLVPAAIVDGKAMTAVRTAAVTGLATRYLARPDAHTLMLFGAGTQAVAHLESMMAVRTVTRVVVVSRTQEKAENLVDRARELGARAEIGSPHDVASADLVCTCTTSSQPLFDGSLLRPGTHVNAIGAYRSDLRELDDQTVRRGRLVVEAREAALTEAGDITIPLREGVISERNIVADLAEIVQGAVVRTAPTDITVFKSVGIAIEDLIVAHAATSQLEATQSQMP